jgi:hypothetical protein
MVNARRLYRYNKKLPQVVLSLKNKIDIRLSNTENVISKDRSYYLDKAAIWCRVWYITPSEDSYGTLLGPTWVAYRSKNVWSGLLANTSVKNIVRFRCHPQGICVALWNTQKKCWNSGKVLNYDTAYVYILNILMKGPGWAWRTIR